MKTISHILLTAICSVALSYFAFNYLHERSAADEAAPVQYVKHEETIERPDIEWAKASAPVIVSTPPEDFVHVSASATAGVVNITSYTVAGSRESSGSGVIISDNGYIITNKHVIEDGARFLVSLADKRDIEAEVVGTDVTTDLALLKIDVNNLRPIAFGDSDAVSVGEWVLAVGNPFNLASTVTAGIVSAKGRSINILDGAYSIESFIQTDAVVNPGNSGGALINKRGELIGINTAIISESGGYEGYSFAIPSNLVRKVIEDLRTYGRVRRAVLGVRIVEINANMADRVGLSRVSGVYIDGVISGGSAAKAGLQAGDVILEVNGNNVNSVPELQEQVARYRPGDRIDLQIFRDGRRLEWDNIVLRELNE